MTTHTPQLNQCLAHEILRNPDAWLGMSSPTALAVFLAGAELRAAATEPSLPSWRIKGPLNQPDFYQPLIERTGKPTLSIKWATALELHHFSMTAALAELRQLIEERFATGNVTRAPVGTFPLGNPHGFWKLLAKRPGMYMGGGSGWHLSWYLSGVNAGGDWLELPEIAGSRDVASAIEHQSEECYGSKFGAFRVYEHHTGAASLLAWAGIEGEP